MTTIRRPAHTRHWAFIIRYGHKFWCSMCGCIPKVYRIFKSNSKNIALTPIQKIQVVVIYQTGAIQCTLWSLLYNWEIKIRFKQRSKKRGAYKDNRNFESKAYMSALQYLKKVSTPNTLCNNHITNKSLDFSMQCLMIPYVRMIISLIHVFFLFRLLLRT